MKQITRELIIAMNNGDKYIIHTKSNNYISVLSRTDDVYFINNLSTSIDTILVLHSDLYIIHANSLITAYYNSLVL